MKGTCRTLGGIILVLGVIGTIVLAIVGGKVQVQGFYSVHSERSVGLTIGYLFAGGLTTAFTSTVFFALGELLDELQSVRYLINEVVKNVYDLDTKISGMSDLSKPQGALNSHVDVSDAASSIHGASGVAGWSCPECNRKHRSYESSCECGYYKG